MDDAQALSQPTALQAIDVISDLAQRRRREAQAELEKTRPDFVLEVMKSEVRIVLQVRALPYAHVDFDKLNAALRAQYGLRFVRPALDQFIALAGVDPRKLDDAQIGNFLLGLSDPLLHFEKGRFPTARNNFVPIEKLTFGYEHIFVVVEGVSAVADLVAQEAIELLWASTGASKRWDDLRPLIITTNYATATKVMLGFPPERLLAPGLRQFLDEAVIGGKGYAAKMGSLSARHNFQPPQTVMTAYTFKDLELRFHRFDKATGVSGETLLDFDVIIRDEAGTGALAVKSNLSYDTHVALLGELRQALSKCD